MRSVHWRDLVKLMVPIIVVVEVSNGVCQQAVHSMAGAVYIFSWDRGHGAYFCLIMTYFYLPYSRIQEVK